jgi:RimJ/RimL family protein N-acetyltransferase
VPKSAPRSLPTVTLWLSHVVVKQLNILPPHQRTFVNTHACGLLLNYALNPPGNVIYSAPSSPNPMWPTTSPGLGLRRAQWFANALNVPSRRAAERLGYKYEGTLRWHRILPAHKIDKASQEGVKAPWEDGRGSARDSVVLGLCWDDWLQKGGFEHVRKLMDRV